MSRRKLRQFQGAGDVALIAFIYLLLVFILLVKNIKTRKVANASGLEAFAEED